MENGPSISDDRHFAARLPDVLNTAFALLKTRRIPGKVNIDKRAETLEVEALRCGVIILRKENTAQIEPAACNTRMGAMKIARILFKYGRCPSLLQGKRDPGSEMRYL